MDSGLTVVIPYTDDGFWKDAACCLARSVMAHSHPDDICLSGYTANTHLEGLSNKYRCFERDGTRWLLSLDADSIVEGDLSALYRSVRESGKLFAGVWSALQRLQRHGWDEEKYTRLFEHFELAEQKLVVTNTFFIRSDLAAKIVPSHYEWLEGINSAFGKNLSPITDTLFKDNQFAFTMALAQEGITDSQIRWLEHGPEVCGPDYEGTSVVRHYGNQRYRREFE